MKPSYKRLFATVKNIDPFIMAFMLTGVGACGTGVVTAVRDDMAWDWIALHSFLTAIFGSGVYFQWRDAAKRAQQREK